MGEMETMACDAHYEANWQATFLANEMRGGYIGMGNPINLIHEQFRAKLYKFKCILFPSLHLTSRSMLKIVALDFPTRYPP